MARAAEGAFLLRLLCDHNLGRLAARLPEGERGKLRGLRFRWGQRGWGWAVLSCSCFLDWTGRPWESRWWRWWCW